MTMSPNWTLPRRVVGKARGGHHGRSRPEQLQRRVESDLDPGAGHEGHSSVQVGSLEPLLVVELGARRAQRVVEGVQLSILGLADVAGPGPQNLDEGLRPRRSRLDPSPRQP